MDAQTKQAMFPNMGMGLGLRTPHYRDILDGRTDVAWFEAISENYMDDGGRPILMLEKIRERYPIALHGVSLSIASTDPLDQEYLKRLKDLVGRIEPSIVSDHCCWTGVDGQNLHDLMPIPYTDEVLNHVAERILQVQDVLGRRILIENVSSYIAFRHSEMTEADFLAALSEKADCGLLLDVNNVYVNSVNHAFDAGEFLKTIPKDRVGQIHLAGHSRTENADGSIVLVDTHDQPVCSDVWNLYRQSVERFGAVSTMIEWDAAIPDHQELLSEIGKAKIIQEAVIEKR